MKNPGQILLLYHQPLIENAPTIMEHVNAFALSRFHVVGLNTELGFNTDLSKIGFDVIVLHYSIFGIWPFKLEEQFQNFLAQSNSYKIAFFQDEYRFCRHRFEFINRFSIDAIYTLIEPPYFKDVYGKYARAKKLIYTLPGYVSDDLLSLSRKLAIPDSDRRFDIGYRGRQLAYYMGRGAQEKHDIGVKFLERASRLGLKLDIKTGEGERIYGNQWYEFVANCRGTLGVESGVSVFDLEDRVYDEYKQLVSLYPNITFDEFENLSQEIASFDNKIPYRTISPRHFESAAFRVCQIMYEGEYSGTLQPMVHYIPLKKDFSNFDEAIRLFQDEKFRLLLTQNTHRDLIESGNFSYKKFIEQFDQDLLDMGFTPESSRPRLQKQKEAEVKSENTISKINVLPREADDNSVWKDLEVNQWQPEKTVEQIQFQRLRLLIAHAYEHVPYYRKTMDHLGMHPANINSWDDFTKLPILTKKDIQKNQRGLIANNFNPDQLLRDSTGGSTGNPISFYRDLTAQRWLNEAANRFRRWIGYLPEDKLALIWGADRDIPSAYPPNQRWLNSFNVTPEKVEAFYKEIVNWRPRAIRAYASSIYLVASYIKQQNGQFPFPIANGIEVSAEKLWDWQRPVVEEVFGCKVFNMYGSREVPSIGCECEFHSGLHIFSDIRVVEIIKDGRPALPGEAGSVVITDLLNYGMPFIRYEIGDVGEKAKESCKCGRGFPLLADIKGRVTSTITTPDGRYIHGEYFTHLFYNKPGIAAFQVRQVRLNFIDISIQPSAGFAPRLVDGLIQQMREHLGNAVEINVNMVSEIPPAPSGKFHFTISDVPVDISGAAGPGLDPQPDSESDLYSSLDIKGKEDGLEEQYIINGEKIEFDEDYYLGIHKDVAQAVNSGYFRSGWQHYVQFGYAEKRVYRSGSVLSTPVFVPSNDPPHVDFYQVLDEADRAFVNGDLQADQKKLSEALAVDATNPELIIANGNLLLRLGETEGAWREFVKAVTLAPDHVQAHINLAAVLMLLDRLDEAERVVLKIMQQSPDQADVLKLYGRLCISKGTVSAAVPMYLKVLRSNPDDEESLITLGSCYLNEGDKITARALFQRALQVNPSSDLAQKGLALAGN